MSENLINLLFKRKILLPKKRKKIGKYFVSKSTLLFIHLHTFFHNLSKVLRKNYKKIILRKKHFKIKYLGIKVSTVETNQELDRDYLNFKYQQSRNNRQLKNVLSTSLIFGMTAKNRYLHIKTCQES
jgi:hypothetical protein